jgi:hypothetical protein
MKDHRNLIVSMAPLFRPAFPFLRFFHEIWGFSRRTWVWGFFRQKLGFFEHNWGIFPEKGRNLVFFVEKGEKTLPTAAAAGRRRGRRERPQAAAAGQPA